MRKCYRCGTPWHGYGSEPRTREICEACGSYYHCCENCHHFDHAVSRACRLKNTVYIGSRTALNYCEEFHLYDERKKASEARVDRALDRWESLFS